MRTAKKTLEPKYALSFVFRFSAIVFAGVGVAGLLLVILLNKKIGPTYFEGISTLSQIQAHLPAIIYITAIIQALALSSIAMIASLFWSQTIAGPLLRFKKYLKEFGRGNFLKEPVNFRNTDQLQGLAQGLTELIISQKDKNTNALILLFEAQKIIDECQAIEKQGKDTPDEIAQALKKLEKIYQAIKDIYA